LFGWEFTGKTQVCFGWVFIERGFIGGELTGKKKKKKKKENTERRRFEIEGILITCNLQNDVVLIFPSTFTATTNGGGQNTTV
jgi:hypothetical protein